MRIEHVETADGSSSLFIPELNEHYHSSHGALQEAVHVFIKYGIDAVHAKKINVFELGFGTGLNALLTLDNAHRRGVEVDYFGLEAFPVPQEIIVRLNYPQLIGENLMGTFLKMHEHPWGEALKVNSNFTITKIQNKIQDLEIQLPAMDIVYFDAFGFRAQPEMWDFKVLEKMYHMLKPGGILVSYAARGQFKRDLKELGFEVESLPGPPGKREMTRAIKL